MIKNISVEFIDEKIERDKFTFSIYSNMFKRQHTYMLVINGSNMFYMYDLDFGRPYILGKYDIEKFLPEGNFHASREYEDDAFAFGFDQNYINRILFVLRKLVKYNGVY